VPGNEQVTTQAQESIERYFYGVKFLYMTKGRLGLFSWLRLMAGIVQAVVMFEVANTLTKIFATTDIRIPYCCPTGVLHLETRRVFAAYQNMVIDVHDLVAKTALGAATQVSSFFATVDPNGTGNMSRWQLFQDIR
jgi:hypothetical protein